MRASRCLAAFAAGLSFLCFVGAGAAQDGGAAAQSVFQPPDPGWTLKGVVLLSRHGMRGPTMAVTCDAAGAHDCLDAVGSDPWPTLDVSAGHLLLGGYERVRTLGRFYRQRYAGAGLIPEQGCPARHSVYFASDAVERTIMTAGAIMDGMFPGCFLENLVIEPGIYRGPACGYDRQQAQAASLKLIGGSWAKVAESRLAGPLAAMDKIVGPLKPDVCQAKGLSAPCSAASVKVTDDDPGAIAFLSAPAEQFIMQYGSGLSAGETGWGRIESATGKPIAEAIAYVNEIHAFGDWASATAPYQASKRGSQTLSTVLRNLTDIADGKRARFRFLASHDNDILSVAGLLGLSWQLDGYARFQVPLGGAIAFELWQPPSGAAAIRLVYWAQTISQLHANAPITLAEPPAIEVLPVGGCATGSGSSCSWPEFAAIAGRAIDPACVAPVSAAP
jgi:4-phytase/acid phosphatase